MPLSLPVAGALGSSAALAALGLVACLLLRRRAATRAARDVYGLQTSTGRPKRGSRKRSSDVEIDLGLGTGPPPPPPPPPGSFSDLTTLPPSKLVGTLQRKLSSKEQFQKLDRFRAFDDDDEI